MGKKSKKVRLAISSRGNLFWIDDQDYVGNIWDIKKCKLAKIFVLKKTKKLKEEPNSNLEGFLRE